MSSESKKLFSSPALGFISFTVSLIGLYFGIRWMLYQDMGGRIVSLVLAFPSIVLSLFYIV